ncbi:MAG: DUF1848 domain-containing protein [Dysgonamonadaceae bacterium]|jgi:hypothetical protein|nr:DUF1848 domain-containing protein [Dysgonamonadaceae bacterium]
MNAKIPITINSGSRVEAHAPVIISASRATDIPAFYAQWFINRLNAGYVVWINPFNRKPVYVSFKNCRVVVFWTKNPKPIIPFLKELDDRHINYYFQFTLNDYEKERFEPNVPPLAKRIETFKELSTLIGKEKVIWRFDPLILSENITTGDLLTKICNSGNQLKGYTDKLVFSFADIGSIYKKVENSLRRENIPYTEFTIQAMKEIAVGIAEIRDHWQLEGWNISLATCAEQIDLEQYGIEHSRCIDGELMKRIFSEDKHLNYYLNYGKKSECLKDKGQRKACNCIISKDIGIYNTCGHFCVYCYANTSKATVEKNIKSHNNDSESII